MIPPGWRDRIAPAIYKTHIAILATSLHDVLHGMIEDAQKYQLLAKRANSTLSQRPVVGPDDELVAGVLKEIERLSHSQAREARRLLAKRVAE